MTDIFFPHIKISYMMRSVDSNAEHFVLAVKVAPADSVIRYREGDYNETVFIKGDGNATPATPEEIISLSKRKYGVDNETSEVAYTDNQWSEYLNLCKEYRQDKSAPTIKRIAERRNSFKRWVCKIRIYNVFRQL